MKGILLAGGHGTRLYPLTLTVSKQLLPVYDKPALYYPLSHLMMAGIREILVISTPRDLPLIQNLLGDGKNFGIQLSYQEQKEPRGIAEAFLLAEKFIQGDSVCLILGDNLFYGHDLSHLLQKSSQLTLGARVFAYHVQDPERYGVVQFDSTGKATAIEEKPKNPRSQWAVTGLYFYDYQVVSLAKQLKPSPRGELEITDLNQLYLERGLLQVELLGRGFAWLDTGTYDSLLNATLFVQTIEKRQGLKIACLEEIAYKSGFISKDQMIQHAQRLSKSLYGEYLQRILNEESTVI